MTHSEGFEKIESTADRMYGPRRLLLCGFSADAQQKLNSLISVLGLSDVPRVWVSDLQKDTALKELFSLPGGYGEGNDSQLPRAIIAGGIQQQELHALMNGCRRSGMKPSLWAVLTPTSENWTLSQLLAALAEEAEAIAKANAKKKTPKR